jgi:hypothetical protein
VSGHNVAYISLELDEEEVFRRISLSILGKKIFSDHMWKKLSRFVRGDIYVKQFPSMSLTFEELRAHLLQLKAAFQYSLLILDYADLLKPSSASPEKRFIELERLFYCLRGLAVDEGVAVFTPSQVNREGIRQIRSKAKGTLDGIDNAVGLDHISASISKAFIADVVLLLYGADISDDAYIKVLKNRTGVAGRVIHVKMNFDLMTIKQGRNPEDLASLRDVEGYDGGL